MSRPPVRDDEALLRAYQRRITLLERRLSRGGGGALPDRLAPSGQQVTDWNNATEVGFYYGTGAANAPSPSTWFTGIVEYDGLHNRIIQTLHNATATATNQREEQRRVFASGVWSVWTRMDVLPDRLAADLPSLGSGVNLNSVLETGWYIQNVSANATLALNYPVARAGHLEVSGGLFGTGADFFKQTYTDYANGKEYQRTYYNGWTAWSPDSVDLAPLFVAGTPTMGAEAILESGWVQLQGAWQMAAGTNPVTPAISYNTAVLIFTLPSGRRPTRQMLFPVGNTAAALMQSAVRVNTDGRVEAFVNNGGSGTTGSHFSLTGVRFRAA